MAQTSENNISNGQLKLGLMGEELLVIFIHLIFGILVFSENTVLMIISLPFAIPFYARLIDIFLVKTISAAMGKGVDAFKEIIGSYYSANELVNLYKQPFKTRFISAYILFLKKSIMAIIGVAIIIFIFWIASLTK